MATGRPPASWRKAFIGPNGLRAGWRLVIFNLIFFLLTGLAALIFKRGLGIRQVTFTPVLFLLVEAVYLLCGWLSVTLMARLERRPLAVYGVPWRKAFGGFFWEGTIWGFVSVFVLVGLIALAGGYRLNGLALRGWEILFFPLLWLLAILVASWFEELVFRGYELYTLATGIGFWPAALILSAIFGFLLHYAEKPNETLVDGFSVTLVALFFALTVRRTGSIWFAAGWHFAFNFTPWPCSVSPIPAIRAACLRPSTCSSR